MAGDGVAVEARLAGAVARYAEGERFDVSVACAELGVSRATFYKYLARFRAEGVRGFFPRSRAPRRRPRAVSAGVEDAVVLAREVLAGGGDYAGATSIRWWLLDNPDRWQPVAAEPWPVPSRATVNRVLDRRGLLVRHPRRRPRSSRRFTRAARNDLWQMDGFEHRLSCGQKVVVIEVLDDHSRLMLACHAAPSENGEDAWTAFTAAVGRYGLPRQLLTDNGTAFNGHRRGWTSQLEAGCADLGVRAISSSVAHPQTCGKSERGHQSTQRWLACQPAADTLEQLADQLQTWRGKYNQRRHQSLHGLTPDQAWQIAPVSGPYGAPLAAPLQVTTVPVSASGCVKLDHVEIGLGRAHKHRLVTAFRSGDDVAIFDSGTLLRELTLDRTRHYQPRG